MTDEQVPQGRTIDTDGGAYVDGGVHTGGDFIGRDKVTRVDGPVAVGGGEAVDMRGAQGAIYKPSGPVHVYLDTVRIQRARLQRHLLRGLLAAGGVLIVVWLVWASVKDRRPRSCAREIAVSERGILASAAMSDADGIRWWVGRSGGGLATWTESMPRAAYDADDLQAETVRALAVDAQSRQIWVGTSGCGLTVLAPTPGRSDWRPYTPVNRYDKAGEGGLPGCRIRSIYLDARRVYVGALDGVGLGVLGPDKLWRTIEPPPGWEPGALFIANDMAGDRDGRLWVGTNYGLYHLERDRWSQPYQPPWDPDPPDAVNAVAVGAQDVLWIGTARQGLALYDLRDPQNRWIGPIQPGTGLASNTIHALQLLPAGDGALVGTEGGLSICRLEGGEKRSVECQSVEVEGLTGVPVYSMALEPAGKQVLVGTVEQEKIIALAELLDVKE